MVYTDGNMYGSDRTAVRLSERSDHHGQYTVGDQQQFDGERVMTASVGQAALDGLFDGNVDLLQSMIERYCPVEMSCSAQASENGAVVSMSVPFATYEEYQNKIEAILAGAGDRVNSSVYYEYSDNLFKTGYTVEEKFCSEDLFYC